MPRIADNIQAVDTLKRVLNNSGISFRVMRARNEAPWDIEVEIPAQKKRLFLEWRHSLAPHQLDALKSRLTHSLPADGLPGLVMHRLTQRLLDRCRELNLFVFDSSGNGYLRLPGIYYERFRPTPFPTRQVSAGTGFTGKASRLVRALLTLAQAGCGQRRVDLASQTGLSSAYVSILIKRFVHDGYLSDRFSGVHVERPDQLLDAWSAHYRFDRHRQFHYALNANSYGLGAHKLGKQLQEAGVRYAFTGWSAAYLLTPHAEPATLMAYIDRAPDTADFLFPVEKQGNVILLLPQDNGVFQFLHEEAEAGPVVCDAQAYVDLCRMPGRAQEQAAAFRHDRLNFGKAG